MLSRVTSSLLIFLALVSSLKAGTLDFASLVDSAERIEPDYSRQAGVKNLVIDRGGVKFVLSEGTITLSQTVLGRVIAATFEGKGKFEMDPPNSAERYMLARLCKDSTADWEFKKLTMFFTDSTARELGNEVSFSELGVERDQGDMLHDFVDYVNDEFKEAFGAKVVPDLIQPQLPGRFMANFKGPRGKMTFFFDPKDVEEISLYKQTQTSSISYPELICSFHSLNEYEGNPWGPDHEDKDLIDSLEYQIDVKIWQSGKLDAEINVAFLPTVDSLRSLSFWIYGNLNQNSVTVLDENGDSLYWDKLKEENQITVYLNKPLSKSRRSNLTFLYSSKHYLRKTSWGNAVLEATTSWYPRYGYMTRAKYKLKFSCPEQYEFLSVGKRVSERVEGDFKITEWDISEFPVAVVSFNYGLFISDSTSLLDGTPLEVFAGKSHGAFSKGLRDAVTSDLKASAAMFAQELVKYPFHKLWATEIPANYGQGLPGLVYLSWASFEAKRAGYTDAFVSHELAHQWWGHLVGWESYHDQWLSEGFSEYMAAWYIQQKYQNDELYRHRFLDLLDDWRNDIMESGSYQKWGGRTAYQEGNEAGPIWMGARLASSKSSDYTTLVYSKGAYVLYMLRMMMYDFVKRDDSRFSEMLREFIDDFRWSDASTADFERVAEKHYGEDLSWFFNEYVYGTEIPHYRWKASVSKEMDGRYLVSFDIETEGVSDGFRMLVPITIAMEGDYHTTARLTIDRLKQRITLPKLPYRPTRIIFNTSKSVLCTDSEM
jgi:hypothetical protein